MCLRVLFPRGGRPSHDSLPCIIETQGVEKAVSIQEGGTRREALLTLSERCVTGEGGEMSRLTAMDRDLGKCKRTNSIGVDVSYFLLLTTRRGF